MRPIPTTEVLEHPYLPTVMHPSLRGAPFNVEMHDFMDLYEQDRNRWMDIYLHLWKCCAAAYTLPNGVERDMLLFIRDWHRRDKVQSPPKKEDFVALFNALIA
jgi:hypothetical protein